MSVKIADKIIQYNNGTYMLMDASAVEYRLADGNTTSVQAALENGVESKEDVERLLGLTKEEIEAMTDLILDTEVRLNKTYSSSKIHSDIQDAIDSSKSFTLAEIGKMSGASYKVVASTTEMTDEKIIYLLENGTTYDMYIVETTGTVTKIGDTTIDLSSYLKVTDAESAYLKKTEATSTYVAQTSFNNHITDTVAHLTQFEKNKLLTTDNITSTINNSSDNTQVPTAKATYDLANTKADTRHTHIISDIKGLSIPSNVSELTNDAGYISEVINTLTSTDTDKPLSANQGKVLKDEVDLKANDSEVVKKTDISTTINSASTDDEIPTGKAIFKLLQAVYPVGSVYINTIDINPSTIFGFGTWKRVAQNMTLWGASANGESGATKYAGLPNITGEAGYIKPLTTGSYYQGINYKNGCFAKSKNITATPNTRKVEPSDISDDNDETGLLKFDASSSNSIYGKSTTVQPPALVVNIWKRVS